MTSTCVARLSGWRDLGEVLGVSMLRFFLIKSDIFYLQNISVIEYDCIDNVIKITMAQH